MADTRTIQVVRVDPYKSTGLWVEDGKVYSHTDDDWGKALVGDVIELTEDQSNFPGGNSLGRRWVSRREPVDA